MRFAMTIWCKSVTESRHQRQVPEGSAMHLRSVAASVAARTGLPTVAIGASSIGTTSQPVAGQTLSRRECQWIQQDPQKRNWLLMTDYKSARFLWIAFFSLCARPISASFSLLSFFSLSGEQMRLFEFVLGLFQFMFKLFIWTVGFKLLAKDWLFGLFRGIGEVWVKYFLTPLVLGLPFHHESKRYWLSRCPLTRDCVQSEKLCVYTLLSPFNNPMPGRLWSETVK